MSMVETAPSKIQVRNLNFYYGKFHALKNINLDICLLYTSPSPRDCS